MRVLKLAAFGLALVLASPIGQAETLIVAIGASNTAGKGVSKSQAWPAQLEALLDTQGYDVRIINAGVNGDDIARIRKRLGTAVPKGTRIILLDPGFMNSKKRGVNVEDNMASIQQWVKTRRVKLVVIRKLFYQAGSNLQADGQHFTPAGHALVAAKLAPQVRALLRK